MFKKIWLIFINTFTISLTANSGYAMIGVFKNRFVDKYGWFSKEEMDDYIALAQSCPGPLAAVFGVILPPFIMMILVTFFYTFISTNPYVRLFIGGMQMGVCAMLLDVVLGLFNGVRKMNNIFYYIMVVLCFLVVCLSKLSVFYLALLCIAVAIVKTLMIKIKVEEGL